MGRRCNMKKVAMFLAFSFLLSSCASKYGKENDKREKSFKEKDGVTI